jgi:hypothetical protein
MQYPQKCWNIQPFSTNAHATNFDSFLEKVKENVGLLAQLKSNAKVPFSWPSCKKKIQKIKYFRKKLVKICYRVWVILTFKPNHQKYGTRCTKKSLSFIMPPSLSPPTFSTLSPSLLPSWSHRLPHHNRAPRNPRGIFLGFAHWGFIAKSCFDFQFCSTRKCARNQRK